MGGAYNGPDRYPRGYDLRVWCRMANQPRAWGIEFIMDELEGHGFRGSFFTEAFCAQYFGLEGLGRVCDAIRSRGHDIQLHLHPGMLNLIPGADRQVNRQPDSFHAYDLDHQIGLLQRGLAVLADCGIDSVTAFRAGSFAVDHNTWTAMRRVGLRMGSNYNLAYLAEPDGQPAQRSRLGEYLSPWTALGTCRLPADPVRNDLFAAPGTGRGDLDRSPLHELPITNIRAMGGDGRVAYRHLAIPALSAAEMIRALVAARRGGLRHVTLLMHSFDFVRLDSARDRAGRPIQTHVRRLRRVCDWLSDHADAFEVTTVTEVAKAPAANHRQDRTDSARAVCDAVPRGSLILGGLRQAEQLCTRLRYR
ncbi:MAG: hypothetical protein IID40_08525 [Planctomycetes bacterium]|nr:hypothetical protein [Planctomycetota bacterium]